MTAQHIITAIRDTTQVMGAGQGDLRAILEAIALRAEIMAEEDMSIDQAKLDALRVRELLGRSEVVAALSEDDRRTILRLVDNRQPERSDAEILVQTNYLALNFAKLMGWQTPKDFEFHRATDVRAQLVWQMACMAQGVLTQTDVSNALANLNHERTT